MPRHSQIPKLGVLLAVIGNVCAKTITTTNGTIQGGVCATSSANTFLGIPYALPPFRFAAPEPYNKTYDGVLDGSVQPPRCPQFGLAYVEDGKQSEDCLYVDVWVPSTATNESDLPVKVWLYGGGNEGGAVTDPLYDGCNSAVDSIVVSVNYRLGPLGFLAYPDAGITGNYGIQDQLLALQWVQDEISSFGGDPDKVLLFGQSAGAWDSYAIASLPQAPSLMKAAAFQSGGGSGTVPVNDTKALYGQYITSLNCSLDGAALDCLRKTPLTAMNKTLIAVGNSGGDVVGAGTLIQGNGSGNAWLPVVDGHIIPQNPASVGTRVPAIIGNTAAEGSLDVLTLYSTAVGNITQADYNKFLENGFGPLAATVNETYPWSDFVAASPLTGLAAMTTVITDYAWKCPTYRALQKAAANGVDAWAYSFNHTPSCRWYASTPDYPQVLELLGATHTSEIPFVFGWTSNMPPPDGTCNFTAAEVAISNFMVGAWTSMAATGRPANESAWPAWTASGHEGITIGESVVAAGPLNYSECEFWEKIEAAVLQLDGGNGTASNATTNTLSQDGAASSSTGSVSGSSSGIRVSGWNFLLGLSSLLMVGML